MEQKLLQIKATHFTAGAIFEFDKEYQRWFCCKAAPIIKYMIGWSANNCALYIKGKGWSYEWVRNVDAQATER